MIERRAFLACFLGFPVAGQLVAWLCALPGQAQQAIMEKGKAVVCDREAVKCPNGHDTCAVIDAPIAIGNDSYQYPDVKQLRDYHVLRCDVCKVLFTRE